MTSSGKKIDFEAPVSGVVFVSGSEKFPTPNLKNIHKSMIINLITREHTSKCLACFTFMISCC